MNDEGYTLAETLAALTMLGLTMGGLAQSVTVIGRYQASAAALSSDRAASVESQKYIDLLLEEAGPFRQADQTLAGTEQGFAFPCGARNCSARVQEGKRGLLTVNLPSGEARQIGLGRRSGLYFQYYSQGMVHDRWPPTKGRPDQSLQGIKLTAGRDGAQKPLAYSTVWIEQERLCQFDDVAGDCARGVQ